MNQNCDNCKYYRWYHDYCDKYKCQIDPREVHNCFEPRKKWLPDTITAENTKEQVSL